LLGKFRLQSHCFFSFDLYGWTYLTKAHLFTITRTRRSLETQCYELVLTMFDCSIFLSFFCLGWARTPFVESHVSLLADSAVKLLQAPRLHVLQTLLTTTGANKFDDFEVVVLVHQVTVWESTQIQKLPCLNFKLELIQRISPFGDKSDGFMFKTMIFNNCISWTANSFVKTYLKTYKN
jgi:hypothetical protein